MPVSAQEHRVRTGLYSSCKGVWLSRQKFKHVPPTTKTRSNEETECDTFDLQMMWFLATVILLVPLMYTTTMISIMALEVLLQINIFTGGCASTVHDVSHQARLDLSWVIDVYHLVIKICSWLVQHRRMVTLFSLLCVFLISTVTAVVCLIIRHRYKQTVHRVVIVLQGGKILVDVQKVSTGHSSQRLMCVSLLVAILTANLLSLMLIKSGDVELNPGPLTNITPQPSNQLQDQPNHSISAGPSSSDSVRLLPIDLHEVYESLLPTVCPKWYNFGLALSLTPATLESIKLDNHERSETCLREALLKRLCKEPLLTWSDIVKALRQTSVAENTLAIEKERKHHLVGSVADETPLDKMRSALSGEPTLEELCSLPVENVWHSLGLWLGVEERRLWEIKKSCQSKNSDNKVQKMLEAFISAPVETTKYNNFIQSLPQEKRTIVESFFKSKVPQELDEYNEMISQLPDDQKKIGEELLQEKLIRPNYQQLVRALVKVGKREVAEEICVKKGVSLTDYLAATDPASNSPECVVRYASYLKDRYKQMSVLPDPDWPPAISTEQHFTNLALIQRGRDHRPDIRESQTMAYDYAHGNIDNIVARKHNIQLEEVFLPIIDKPSKESRLTILMDGAPGVGKTTITRKLCIDWANGEILQEYQLVILVSLREIMFDQTDHQSITDLLPADSPRQKCFVLEHITDTSGANVLFIFDGFDELSHKQREQRSLFLEIINGKKLHRCSVLVTSRPYASLNLRCLNHANRHVEVLGFSEKQIRDCIYQNLPHKEGNQLIRNLKERLDIQSLCYIPLISRIVLFVYGQEYKLPSTLTQLYDLFLLHTVKHHAEKITSDVTIIEEIKEACSISELPQFVQTQLDDLSKLAFISIEEDKLIFTSKELSKPNVVLSLGLLNALPCFTTAGLLKYYQFLHLTIQEFLAARHLMSDTMSDENKTKFIQKNIKKTRFRMTLLFLAGLTRFNFLPSEESLLGERTLDLSSSDGKEFFLFLAQLVYESQTSIRIMSTLITKLDLSGWKLTQFDCLVLAHFLSMTPHDHIWEVINLSSCGLSTHSFLNLLSKEHVTTGIPAIAMTRTLNIENNPYISLRSILPVISKNTLPMSTEILTDSGLDLTIDDQADLHVRVQRHGLSTLRELLHHNKSIVVLNASNRDLTDDVLKEISDYLSHKSLLRELDISYNHYITSEGWKKFFIALQQSTTDVQHCYLRKNITMVTSEVTPCSVDIERIPSSNQTLEILNVSDCNLTDKVLGYIATCLTHNITLTELHLGSNLSVTSVGWIQLFRVIQNGPTAIRKLSINDSKLETESVKALGEMLCDHKHLEMLGVRECFSSDDSFEIFSEGLSHNKTLKEIDISHNTPITSKGWVHFFRALQSADCITTLDISSNFFGREEFSTLKEFHHKSIVGLKASYCYLIDEVLKKISDYLSQESSLRELDISLNKQITSEGWEKFFRALQHNTSLKQLNIEHSYSLRSGQRGKVMRALSEMITHNKGISELTIDGDFINNEYELFARSTHQ